MRLRRTVTAAATTCVLGLGALAGTAHAGDTHTPSAPTATKPVSAVADANWWDGRSANTAYKYRLFTRPSSTAPVKGTLPANLEVKILRHNQTTHWDKIQLFKKVGKLKKGTTGYLHWADDDAPICVPHYPQPCNAW